MLGPGRKKILVGTFRAQLKLPRGEISNEGFNPVKKWLYLIYKWVEGKKVKLQYGDRLIYGLLWALAAAKMLKAFEFRHIVLHWWAQTAMRELFVLEHHP